MKRVLVLWPLTLLLIPVLFFFENCAQPNDIAPTTAASREASANAVVLVPASSTVGLGVTVTYYGSGGTAPYTYTVLSGTGTITAAGVFTAPQTVEIDQVQITDASGHTAAVPAVVNVTATASVNGYSYVASGFGACSVACGAGSQSQAVNCEDNNGVVVSSSLCTGAAPATTQACNGAGACAWAETAAGPSEGLSPGYSGVGSFGNALCGTCSDVAHCTSPLGQGCAASNTYCEIFQLNGFTGNYIQYQCR